MMDQCDNVLIVDGKEYVIEYKNKNTASQDIRMLRVYAGMNRKEFAEYLHIPYRTMTEWERGGRI